MSMHYALPPPSPTCEHALRRRRLREGNHVPDGGRAGEQHGEAIEAEGHAAMRGGTVLKAVQQVAELGLKGGVQGSGYA